MCESCSIQPTPGEASLLSRRRMLGVGAAVGVVGAAAVTAGADSAEASVRSTSGDSISEFAAHGPGGFPGGLPVPIRRRHVPTDNISIQLYTLRDLLAKDLDGTLAALAKIGFRRVENAGYQGLTPKQFRAALDRHGLRSTSGHNASVTAPFDAAAFRQVIADAHTVGQTYLNQSVVGLTGFGPSGVQYLQTKAEWQRLCEALNKAGEMAHHAGLAFGLHNHFWEFLPLTDSPLVGSDILIAETDPRYVHFEIDIFWAHYGHHDPAQLVWYLQNRMPQFHVKDMKLLNGEPAPSPILSNFTWTDPGKGIIDFTRIFAVKLASPRKTEYIIERDDAGANALTTAKVGFDFLKSIRF